NFHPVAHHSSLSLKLHFRRIRQSGFRTGKRVGVRRKARNTVHAEVGGAYESIANENVGLIGRD
ncbi:hypothetical protein K443DRAFT_686022, partial [Laccaria amethystina LaAM-08-1]